ncbi:MAG: hypothetical protein R2695_20450 [Acidimicrobiales bacterium]
MTGDRDDFLADRLGRITPPPHRPGFWADLQETLAMTSADPGADAPSGSPTDLPDYAPSGERGVRLPRGPRLVAIAASLVLVAGVAAAVWLERPRREPGGRRSRAGHVRHPDSRPGTVTVPDSSPDSVPTDTQAGEPGVTIDLTGAVDLGRSSDGKSTLYAVPADGLLGCEGQPSLHLYWVADDGTGTRASDVTFLSPPDLVRGPDGRVALLTGCEEQSSTLHLGVEAPAGHFDPLLEVDPLGWEGATVHAVSWSDDGRLQAQVSRFDDLLVTRWAVIIDPVTGDVVDFTPESGAACSASELSDVSWAQIGADRPWGATARAVQAAALSCDYDALGALARGPFRYSFGGGTDFVGFLREAEAQPGADITAKLVRLLEVDPGVQDGDPTLRVWPAFFGCESTCGMDRAEIRRLGYTDADIAGFEEFGGYIGYRVGFVEVPNADGSPLYEWTFFVAGD